MSKARRGSAVAPPYNKGGALSVRSTLIVAISFATSWFPAIATALALSGSGIAVAALASFGTASTTFISAMAGLNALILHDE